MMLAADAVSGRGSRHRGQGATGSKPRRGRRGVAHRPTGRRHRHRSVRLRAPRLNRESGRAGRKAFLAAVACRHRTTAPLRSGIAGGREPEAPVSPSIDPVVAQATCIAPGAHGIRVDTKKPGGLGDREGRVGWALGSEVGTAHVRKCEVDGQSLPISQFLTMGRWSRWPCARPGVPIGRPAVRCRPGSPPR